MARESANDDRTFIEMAFRGTWRIRAGNGEFIDVTPAGEGEPPQLTTSPPGSLRHAFRFRSFEDLGDNRWAVWAEPVPLETPQGQAARMETPHQYPLVLAYPGYNRFVLEELPAGHALRSRSSALTMLGGMDEGQGLHFEVDAFTFLNTESGINFPVFTGDEQLAFTHINTQLGFDPHSSLLTLAALSNCKKPDGINPNAWDKVVAQLRDEIDCRELVGKYFEKVENFVQNVFISNAGLVENVGTYVGLERQNVVRLMLNAALQSIAGAVGGMGFPGAFVVAGALKLLFQQLAKDKGSSAGDFRVALAEARTRMSDLFDAMITAIQNWRSGVYKDWGKLKTMGQEVKSGQLAWPDNDEQMRKEAKKQLEISLYKDLVKEHWHHMTASDDPMFHTRTEHEMAAWRKRYMEKNKNSWVVVVPRTEGSRKGFNSTEHWLGRGCWTWTHQRPKDTLAIKLFTELQIPHATVFNEWGLERETWYG